MCNFMSAIVTRDGRLLRHDWIDAHEDLVYLHRLRDDKPPQAASFVRVEFAPPADDPQAIADPTRYALRLDEPDAPAWWDDELRGRVVSDLRGVIERMIVRHTAPILAGGAWIIAGNVGRVLGARVVAVVAGGTVQRVWSGGTVQRVEDGAGR